MDQQYSNREIDLILEPMTERFENNMNILHKDFSHFSSNIIHSNQALTDQLQVQIQSNEKLIFTIKDEFHNQMK